MANRQRVPPGGDKEVNKMAMKNWPWLGSLIALIVPFGYILAYVHEVSFCHFFRIPEELIQLNWTITLIAIAEVMVGVVVLGGIIYIPFLFKKGGPRKWRTIYTIMIFLLTLYFACEYSTVEESKILTVLFFLFVLLVWFMPCITQRKKHGYIKKLKAEDQSHKAELLRTPKIIKYVLLGFYALVIFVGVANLGGRNIAMREQAWYVPSTYPQSVVLRIYGENLICAPIVAERKVNVANQVVNEYFIRESYFVLKANEEPPPVLEPIRQGYLRLYQNEMVK